MIESLCIKTMMTPLKLLKIMVPEVGGEPTRS